jgi:Protein of unknown function (DUF3500)
MKPARHLGAPMTVAVIGAAVLAAGCGSGDDTTASASASSTASPAPTAGGGPGGPGGSGGGMQTFTAVDLNTSGENASGANTSEVVAAANSFLGTLNADVKAKLSFAFTDNQSRQTWSNFPTTSVPRKGVPLGDLDDAGKAAALALVKTMLSAEGYDQVLRVQKSDDWLKANSSGGNSGFGDELYYIAIYGTPSTTAPFMVQFGGHHLARNYTYKGTTASITPAFTGTEPKTFTLAGTTVEPMKLKASTFFAAIDSLTTAQDTKAKLSATVSDILMGPGVDAGTFPTSEGLAVSELSDAQKKLVLDAIGAWVNDAAPDEAASLLGTYQGGLDETKIAYANSKDVDGESTYLRIDGPRVWIELINTRSQSTPNVHYHGVFRDKNDDYGSSNPSTA